LLTKFDTVSDKVGAALTMTHATNAPILFVETGQKYHHLQEMKTIVQ
jgi:signal recognition particle receptor subunit alpha